MFANSASRTTLGIEPSVVVGTMIGDFFANSLTPGGPADIYRDVVVDQRAHDLGVVSYGDVDLVEQRFRVTAFPLSADEVAILFESLSASPERATELAAIVESAEDAILSKTLDGTILTWNAAATRIYGYAADEAIGRHVSMLLPPDRPNEVVEILDRLATGGRVAQFETRRVRKDAAVIDVSLTVSPIRDVHDIVVGAATIARDITAEKAAQAQTHELAAIVAASQEAMYSRTPDGVIRSWNAAAERLFGYTAEEIIGRSTTALASDPSRGGEGTDRFDGLRRRINCGEVPDPFEATLRRKDGREVHVSIASSPIRDPAGELVRIAFVLRDLTEQRKLETQLRQAQKMEAIGRLASGVAHDFNNILTVVRGASQALLRSVQSEDSRDLARTIDRAAVHAATLTGQLLAFGRQQVLRPQPTDLNQVVDATLELAARLLDARIRLDRQLDPELALIQVDAGQLQQVILNLLVNAAEAMPDGGALTVETSNAVLDENYAHEHLEVTPGAYVLLELTDSGTGMDAETLGQIFEPFYTTKSTGTGLGLATVYGIVRQSNGHLFVYSERGMGTTFKIYLPLADRDAVAQAPQARSAEVHAAPGGQTILVVEDLDLLRPITALMLETGGYAVLTAASGEEALQVAERHEGQIDLLFTDVVMPGMTGRELSDRLLVRYAGLRVVFSSGYPADTVVRHGIVEGRIDFIQKPYSGNELLAMVQKSLATTPSTG